jgi:PAS domain S-box-containing protein
MPHPPQTAIKKASQTEAFYQAVLEKSYEGIVVVDRAGELVYRSSVNAASSGHPDDELTRENFALFTHPDDQQRMIDTFRQLAPGESRVVETRRKSPGGEWRWLENRVTNLLDNPAVRGYVINTRDIHERKTSEEQLRQTEALYRAITEQSNESVMVMDEQLVVRYRNAPPGGYSNNEIIGFNRSDLIHPEDLERFLLELPHLQAGQTLLTSFRMKSKQGGWDWFEVRITNLLGNQAVRGYVANYYNINERKEAEAVQRELSQRLLSVQEEERRALARELHDEIGQSLTAIKVGLQTAQRLGNLGAAGNLLGITEELLAQVRELSLNLHPKLLEDLGLVAAVRWYVLQQAQRSGLQTELQLGLGATHLPPELSLTVYRVVQEAMTNIIRHSHAKHVTLSLSEKSGNVVLIIKDDGVGFEVDQQDKPGQHNKPSLGLLGMKERVVFLGGRFQIKSSAGAGTELYASFPLPANMSENLTWV